MILTEDGSNLIDQSFYAESPIDHNNENEMTPSPNENISPEKYTELKSELAQVCQKLKVLQDKVDLKVDNQSSDLKAHIEKSIQFLLHELRHSMNQSHESYQNEDITNVQSHTKVAAGQPSAIFTTNEEDIAGVGVHNVTAQSNVHQSFLQRQNHESALFGQPLPYSNNEADTTADVRILDQHDQNHNFFMCNNAEHVSSATKSLSLDDFAEITFT